jgi:hypothetical protein
MDMAMFLCEVGDSFFARLAARRGGVCVDVCGGVAGRADDFVSGVGGLYFEDETGVSHGFYAAAVTEAGEAVG